jgi:hypothetical protein
MRTVRNPETISTPHGYSHVVEAEGRLIFVSSQVSAVSRPPRMPCEEVTSDKAGGRAPFRLLEPRGRCEPAISCRRSGPILSPLSPEAESAWPGRQLLGPRRRPACGSSARLTLDTERCPPPFPLLRDEPLSGRWRPTTCPLQTESRAAKRAKSKLGTDQTPVPHLAGRTSHVWCQPSWVERCHAHNPRRARRRPRRRVIGRRRFVVGVEVTASALSDACSRP